MLRNAKRKRSQTAQTFQWVAKKGAKRSYELRSGSQVLGRMRWPKMFGSLAEGEFGDHRWTFKRGGFLRPRVSVRSEPGSKDSAVLELSHGGGRGLLRTNSGSCFHWSRKGFWSHRLAFEDDKGVELVHLEPKFGLLRRGGEFYVHPNASGLPELPLLLLMGWYVTMLISDDDYTAAIVCAG